MWLACVHFNRLFYSDSNDVRIVWGLWGLFSQVVNSPLLCSTFSSESLAYLLCSPASAHSRLSVVAQSPRLWGVCVCGLCGVCTHACVLFVCMCHLCVLCVCVCVLQLSPQKQKKAIDEFCLSATSSPNTTGSELPLAPPFSPLLP